MVEAPFEALTAGSSINWQENEPDAIGLASSVLLFAR